MAKRSVLAAVALALILGLASVSIGAADFKIGVVTGTVSQGEDEYRGAEAAIQKYPCLLYTSQSIDLRQCIDVGDLPPIDATQCYRTTITLLLEPTV